jgi:hypothetical protein
MNIEVRQPVRGAEETGKARVGIFDCDVHPVIIIPILKPPSPACISRPLPYMDH